MDAWLFDLGNTRLKIAPLTAGGGVGEVRALPHTGDPAAALAAHLPARIDVAYVASVAGEAARVALLDALGRHERRIGLARTPAHGLGVRVAYAQPQRLGVDRFLAMAAARARGGDALVCGVGTALTIDLVDAAGRHHGGCIAPSPTLMREALHERAPHLPPAGGTFAPFAADTLDGLAAGCDGAALALIRERQRDAAMRLGRPPALLLHGGGAAPLLPHLPEARHAPHLVLEGLAIWAAVEQSP